MLSGRSGWLSAVEALAGVPGEAIGGEPDGAVGGGELEAGGGSDGLLLRRGSIAGDSIGLGAVVEVAVGLGWDLCLVGLRLVEIAARG